MFMAAWYMACSAAVSPGPGGGQPVDRPAAVQATTETAVRPMDPMPEACVSPLPDRMTVLRGEPCCAMPVLGLCTCQPAVELAANPLPRLLSDAPTTSLQTSSVAQSTPVNDLLNRHLPPEQMIEELGRLLAENQITTPRYFMPRAMTEFHGDSMLSDAPHFLCDRMPLHAVPAVVGLSSAPTVLLSPR